MFSFSSSSSSQRGILAFTDAVNEELLRKIFKMIHYCNFKLSSFKINGLFLRQLMAET